MAYRDPNATVARMVRRLREQRRLSQAELARRMKAQGLSWHQVTVGRTESGTRPLRLDEAIALAAIFEVELPVLYREPVEERQERRRVNIQNAIAVAEGQLQEDLEYMLRTEVGVEGYRKRVTTLSHVIAETREKLLTAERDKEEMLEAVHRYTAEYEVARACVDAGRRQLDGLRSQLELLEEGPHAGRRWVLNLSKAVLDKTIYLEHEDGSFSFELRSQENELVAKVGPYANRVRAHRAAEELLKG